eukprot:2709723-Pyramimonas_sp.AAC.1
MRGEPIPRSRTMRPSARGARGLFNDPSMAAQAYDHPCLTAVGFGSLERTGDAASVSFCGDFEDVQQLQR